MNYGYAPTDRDEDLADALVKLVCKLGPDPRGQRAYVEVNGLYPGVRIRRLTHYPDDVIEKLIESADQIHKDLIGD